MKRLSYSSKMSFIRPFVSFDFKRPERLGRKNKVLVTKYYNFLQANKNDYAAIKPPRGSNFEKVQHDLNPTFGNIRKRIKKTKFKVIFVPVAKAGSKIKRRGKKYVIETNGIRESIITFEDRDAFASDTREYIESLVRSYPDRTFFRLFNPQDWHDEKFDKGSIANAVTQFFGTFYTGAVNSVMRGAAWGLIVEERVAQ